MLIKPSKKFIVVKPTNVSETKSSHLVVVETEKKKPELGEVVAIGSGIPPVKMKKGSIVAYRAYGGNHYYFSGQEIIFVHYDDILGVILEGGEK